MPCLALATPSLIFPKLPLAEPLLMICFRVAFLLTITAVMRAVTSLTRVIRVIYISPPHQTGSK